MNRVEALRESMLAKGLKEEDLTILAAIADEKIYYKDDAIFFENEMEDGIYILLEGKVAIERRFLPGRHIGRSHIQNVHRGQMFGEMSFIERRPRSATARARSRVRVIRFAFQDLEQLFADDIELANRMLRMIAELLCRRLRRMNDEWLRTIADPALLSEFEYY